MSRDLALCVALAGPFLACVLVWLDFAIPVLEAMGL